jgi:dinuclear metal center YbgI/SA1388 family protein
MARSSAFTDAVVSSMRRLYPETLADKSFDNTGLLLQAPFQSHASRKANSVLLTIDLTKAVADEAIDGNHSVVVAYHPIIFRGLKSITLGDSQQSSLLLLVSNGISVYSPHTAVDITPGGMGDWLCDIVTGKLDAPEPEAYTARLDRSPTSDISVRTSEDSNAAPNTRSTLEPSSSPKPAQTRPSAPKRTYSKPSYISYPQPPNFHHNIISHTREVITPSPESAIQAANSSHQSSSLHRSSSPYNASNTGSGRLITFSHPQPLSVLITRIATAIGSPKGFQIAIPQASTVESLSIRTVGICPGSGTDVLGKASPPPDLLFTGEMTHHAALACIERGGCIIALGHSNSERGYLEAVMKEKLIEEVQKEWNDVRKEMKGSEGLDEGQKEMLEDGSIEVVVSQRDRDPFGIVVLQESAVEGEKI